MRCGKSMEVPTPFPWRHFEAEIMFVCLRWDPRYSLSSRDLEEMMLQRRLHVDQTTISHSRPALCSRTGQALSASSESLHRLVEGDETSITGKNVWMSLSRAGDSEGNPLAFLFSAPRAGPAAQGFFVKALGASTSCTAMAEETTIPFPLRADAEAGRWLARIRPGAKKAASAKARADRKASGMLPASVERRQVKDVQKLIDQDHRFLKRLVQPAMGFCSFQTAWRTRQGEEVMQRIRKGPMNNVDTGAILCQRAGVSHLFGVTS
jgi:IS6 family transposase